MEDAVRKQDSKCLVQLMKDCIPLSESNQTSKHDLQYQLQTLKALITSCLTEIGREIFQISKDETLIGRTGSEAYIVIPDTQWTEPRGRFAVSISGEGILLEGKAMSSFIPWQNISHYACVPNKASIKKEGEELMAFLLSEPVKCNSKDTKTFLWNLSKSVMKEVSATNPSSTSPIVGSEHAVVTTLIPILRKMAIVTPNKELFQSATQQRPYLNCYKSIQEGALYPLKNGIIFLKPLLFIPTEGIASITAGRGGIGSTRYIDLLIDTVDGKSYEFSNIEREELLAIQIYVNEFLEARKRAAIKEEKKLKLNDDVKSEDFVKDENDENQEMNEEDDDDDDESDDEDFDPDASDEDASGRDSDDSGGSDEYSSASENGEDEIRSTKKVLKKRSPKKSAAKVPDDHIRDGIAEEESLLEDENNCLSNSTEDTKFSFIKEEDGLSEQHECISPKEESARKKIRLQSPQNSATEVAHVKEENIGPTSD